MFSIIKLEHLNNEKPLVRLDYENYFHKFSKGIIFLESG